MASRPPGRSELPRRDQPLPNDDAVGSDRNLDAVADAILSLLHEGAVQPGALDIAERSGVSVRAVFRYFEDPEQLFAATIEGHSRRIAHLYELPPVKGTRAERVAVLAAQRRRLYEAATPIHRVAEMYRARSPAVESHLTERRLALRRQLARQFALEFSTYPPGERRLQVDALEVATSWRSWEMLRTEKGCSVARAERVLTRNIMALTETA